MHDYPLSKPVAVLTVVYNNYSVLDDFISSLQQQSNKNFYLYIADASSKPKNISAPHIPHTVIPIENKGYAHGINVGITKAIAHGHTRFCILNDDIFFKKDFINNINNVFEYNRKTIFGGKIYYAPGYEYHASAYSKKDIGRVLWYAGGYVNWSHATIHHRGVDMVDNGQFDKPENTDFITGCMMCFDKEVVDAIGLWNESYFLYYEDADYCEKAKKKNIPLKYIPQIELWHKNAQSTDGSGSKLHENLQRKARFSFGMKYAPLRTKLHLLKNRFLE